MQRVTDEVKAAGGIRLAGGASGCRSEWRELRQLMGKAGIGVFAPAARLQALPPDVMAAHLGLESDEALREALLSEYEAPAQSERTFLAGLEEAEEEQVARLTLEIEWDAERRAWVARDWSGEELIVHWEAERIVRAALGAGMLLGQSEEL